MKSSIICTSKPYIPAFPCLMKRTFDEAIVLFEANSCGTFVHSHHNSIGTYVNTLVMKDFEPFYGSVLIES